MKQRLLQLLRVPERPDPPPGAGDSLEMFRASPGYFRYSVLMWFPKQIAALSGLLFSLAFFGRLDNGRFDLIEADGWDRFARRLDETDIGIAFLRLDLSDILLFFEGLAVLAWVSQLLFTGLLLKLSWELRWYLVGEESLRIRHGLWSVREQTMTIANIQNMRVRQGPVQRFFGISDLEVQTAGGGGAGGGPGEDPTQGKDSFHIGRFRGLKDASALRDKIRKRLQAQKGAARLDKAPASDVPGDLQAAAEALLEEARALRLAVR